MTTSRVQRTYDLQVPLTLPDPGTLRALSRSSSESVPRVDPESMARVTSAHRAAARAREAGEVYGATTGVGALKDVGAGEDDPERALRLWRSHAAGLGVEMPDDVARATMLVRLHQLLRGGSGVSPGLVEGLADALAAGAVPRLHAVGSVGTADLAPLSELGLTLAGELPWRRGGVPPVPVAATDGLPLVSSNALTVAVASLAVADLADLADTAEQVAALSHLALRGSAEAYDARALAGKADPWAAGVAERLRVLLGPPRPAARLQDPFGLRTVPQAHGPWREALSAASGVLSVELGAGAENPLVVEDGVLHHGHFLTQRLATTLDTLRATVHPVATLSTARLSALMDPRLTGLSPFLAEGAPDASGLMILEYVAADLAARLRAVTSPTATGRAVLSLGLEEHASFSSQGAWATRAVVTLLPDLLACELVAAVRALRLDPTRLADVPARELFDRADALLPDVHEDHVLGPEVRAAAVLLTASGGP